MQDPIIPNQGVMRMDRFAYVVNNPIFFIDPSGNKACDEIDGYGNCQVDLDWLTKLTRDGKMLDEFLIENQMSIDTLITWGMAGELGGWGTNEELVDLNITAWEKRYIQFQRAHCHNQPSRNCMLNFLESNSESVMKKTKLSQENISLQSQQSYIGPETYTAATKISRALMNADAIRSSYDPIKNLNDRIIAENVGILPKTKVDFALNGDLPELGLLANQFIYFTPSVHKGEDSYSVVMNYCQEFWWMNDPHVLKQGCFVFYYSR
jgi:hypothetical protein